MNTIAASLGVHHDTVQLALESERVRATRRYDMLRDRGYSGSVVQLRRYVRTVRRPTRADAYLRLETLPGERGQVDWGHFGTLQIGHARRPLACFVLVLSWARALYARFALDQTLESFLRGPVEAFAAPGRGPAHPPLRQPHERRAGARGRSHPFPPAPP